MSNFKYDYLNQDIQKLALDFQREIFLSANSRPSSLSYIEQYLPNSDLVDEVFQVLMFGGSHIESAIIKQENGQRKILKFTSTNLPRLETREILLSLFAKNLDTSVKTVNVVLAYPLQTISRNGRLDGVLLNGSKQHKLAGLIGKSIGQELEEFIYNQQNRQIQVSVCNNLNSIALATKERFGTKQCQNFAVGVVASGVNFGFFAGKNFINLESGNFDKFESTWSGSCIDACSNNIGQHLLEKEIGASYLWQHYNLEAQKLGIETRVFSLNDINTLAGNGVETQNILARQILARSSSLVAAQLAGIYLFKKQNLGLSNHFKLTVVIEGDLFWKGWHYQEMVKEFLEKIGIDQKYVEFIRIKHGFVLGAATLVQTIVKTSIQRYFYTPETALIYRNLLYIGNSPPV